MNKDLQESRSLSLRFEVNLQIRRFIIGDGTLLYYDKEFMRVEMVTRSMIDDEYNNYIRFKVNSSVIME